MNATIKIYLVLLISLLFVGCSEELVDRISSGNVKGTVVKHGTNEPLANIKVTTAPSTQTVFTAEDGSFELTGVPAGDYAVRAEGTGYLMEIHNANVVNDGQLITLVFEMKTNESLNASPTVTIVAPADNLANQPTSVLLSWKSTDADEKDVLSYRVLVRNSRDNKVFEVKDLKETTYMLEDLQFGTDYFWQVAVSDGVNEEVFSAAQKFSTAAFSTNRIHYARSFGENLAILSTTDGSSSLRLTPETVNSLRPKKNNAANSLAFLRVLNGVTHLFVSKLDGSSAAKVSQIPVAGFNAAEVSYAWGSNGKELIYPNFDKLYRVNKDGSGTELVYKTSDGSFISECAWSEDGKKIALKTNDINGYKSRIFVIDMQGNTLQTVLENVRGRASGLDFSADGNKLLYAWDISGYESTTNRQMETHIFLYNLTTGTATDLSEFTKIVGGHIDIHPRFSPNEGQIIFTQTSNDGRSQSDVYVMSIADEDSRKLLVSNAIMPDWE